MTDYSELLKRLRKHEWVPIIKEAADALEAQSKRIAEPEPPTLSKRALSLARAKRADLYKEEVLNSDRERHRLEARISELEAENAKLREAMKQLYGAAQDIEDSEMSLSIREWWRNELRAARAALGENDGNN